METTNIEIQETENRVNVVVDGKVVQSFLKGKWALGAANSAVAQLLNNRRLKGLREAKS